MLFAGPWGWLGYGVTNFASGATSNYAAQKLRGIEDIGWGEVISSGLIDMVPGLGGRAKGLKAVRNYALEGAGRTLAQQQAQVGIDEQRFLTPGEAVTSTALGGTFGAGFGGIGVGASALKSKYGRKVSDPVAKFSPEEIYPNYDPDTKTYAFLSERLNNQINRVVYTQPELKRDEWIRKVTSGYESRHPDHRLIPGGPKGVSTLRNKYPGSTDNKIQLNPDNEEGVLNSIADSIRTQGLDPDKLQFRFTRRGTKQFQGNPALAYWDYVEQYFKKYGTLTGIDRLVLPSGDLVKVNTSSITRAIKSFELNPSKSTKGTPQPTGAHAAGFKDATEQLEALAELEGVNINTVNRSLSKKIESGAQGVTDPTAVPVALEGHHAAGLDRSYYLMWNLKNKAEAKKMENYLLGKYGIPIGDDEFNMIWLDGIGVHVPIHKWMDRFTPMPDEATLQKIYNINTFEGRKKFAVQFVKDYVRAQEMIYRLQQRWLDLNFPGRWKTDAEIKYIQNVLSEDQLLMDDLVNYLETGEGIPANIKAQIEADRDMSPESLIKERPKIPKGPYPSKTQEMKQEGKPRSIPKSG